MKFIQEIVALGLTIQDKQKTASIAPQHLPLFYMVFFDVVNLQNHEKPIIKIKMQTATKQPPV